MNIKDGLVTVKEICGIPVKVDIVQPVGKANVRTLLDMTPLGITVHNTGSGNREAGDEAHASYLKNLEKDDSEYKSWHFTVDSDSITQHLPLNEKGYHAGDGGNGYGNSKTIGIEIAEGAKYKQCEENGVKLICWLMHEYGWTIDAVQPHRKYSKSNKLCPWRILKSQATWETDWYNFQHNVIAPKYNELFNGGAVVDTPDTPSTPVNNHNIKVGDTVKLKKSAIQWNGKNIRADYKKKEYKVKQLDTNGRTVLTIGDVVIYAVDVKYLDKVDTGCTGGTGGTGTPDTPGGTPGGTPGTPAGTTQAGQFKSYLVKVTADALNIRKGPSTSYSIVGVIKDKGVYTIVEEKDNWGKLKSGAGWICLNYTKKV